MDAIEGKDPEGVILVIVTLTVATEIAHIPHVVAHPRARLVHHLLPAGIVGQFADQSFLSLLYLLLTSALFDMRTCSGAWTMWCSQL